MTETQYLLKAIDPPMMSPAGLDDSAPTPYVAHVRTHRLIAGVRVISASLTVVALLALGMPIAEHPAAILAMELGYLTLAAWVWIDALHSPYVTINRPVWLLVIDLAVVLVLLADTHGPVSPFFASALFVVWAADYYAAWRGSVVVAAVLLFAWVTFAITEGIPPGNGTIFVLRTAMMVTLPVCLVWRRVYEERHRIELSRLVSWPRGERTRDAVVRAMLQSAAELVRVDRAVLIWEEEEEPSVHVARWQEDAFELRRETPAAREALFAAGSSEASFLSAKGQEAIVFQKSARPASRLLHNEELRRHVGGGPVMSVFVRGIYVAGRLYFLGRSSINADDLTLGEIAARLMAAELDRLALLEVIRVRAAADERVRLAGDLHDGLLQSMTAVSAQLASLERALAHGSPAAAESLKTLRQIVADDQRELRDFVVDAREEQPPRTRDLEQSLREFAQRFKRRWGIDVEIDVATLPPAVRSEVADGIYSIVHEGLANAAKHGGAARVKAGIRADDEHVTITIDDDGRGFPFHGRFDLATLVKQQRAPFALQQRVTSLQGNMVIDSSPNGTRLEIWLPA